MESDINNETTDPHQIYLARCRKNRIRKLIILILAFVILAYIVASLGYGGYIKTLVKDIYEAKGMDEDMGGRVSEDILSRLDFRTSHSLEYGMPYTETVELSFRPALHWFVGGQIVFEYSYCRRSSDSGKSICGSKDVPVTIYFHIEGTNIVIHDTYEPY